MNCQGGSNLQFKLPFHMIAMNENMYQKVSCMLKFLLHFCEEQEHANQETSLVCINLIEENMANDGDRKVIDEKQGEIQIDVDGSWLKLFNIRMFINDILRHEKLHFTVQYGNSDTNSYYLYNITYNGVIRRSETHLTLEDNAIIKKDYYLRISIITTPEIVQSMFNKLRNFLKITAPKYPSVEIQFNATDFMLKEDMDDKHIRMIAESVGDVIKYGTKFDFRKSVFEMFNVNSKEWAIDVLYNELCHFIPEH